MVPPKADQKIHENLCRPFATLRKSATISKAVEDPASGFFEILNEFVADLARAVISLSRADELNTKREMHIELTPIASVLRLDLYHSQRQSSGGLQSHRSKMLSNSLPMIRRWSQWQLS